VVKGISYTLTKVKNSFRNGLFTQTLEAFINDFGTGALSKEASQEFETAGRPAGDRTSTGGDGGQAAGSSGFDLANQARGTQPDAAPGTGQTPKVQSNTPATPTPEPNS